MTVFQYNKSRTRIDFSVRYLVQVSVSALAAAMAAASAHAQDPTETRQPAAEFRRLDTVVVTGVTKQDADLQDTPIAITAFSGDALEAQGITDVGSVATFTPGFNVRAAGNNPNALNFSMRGQIQNDNLATLEPSVGVYLDEFYVARAYGINANMVDMESVQVLKGPQGTLFGRNTSAGAVLLQTADPELGEYYGKVKFDLGRFSEKGVTGILNVPLGDNAALRGAVYASSRDSYQTDVRSGEEYGERDTFNGRLKFAADLTDDLHVLVSGEWFDGYIKGPARQNQIFVVPSLGVDVGAGDRLAIGGDPDNVAITPNSAILGTPNDTLFNKTYTQTYVGKVSYDLPFGELKLIAGHRSIEGDNIIDLDGASLAAPNHFTGGSQDLEETSVELQLTGQAFNDFVDFATGVTYMGEEGFDQSRSATGDGSTWSGFKGELDNTSYGVYGQVAVHATDKLNINAGLRYSEDEKGVTAQSAVFPVNGTVPAVCLPTSFQAALIGNGLTASDCNRSRTDRFDNVSYTIGVDYQITDDIMVYAKQSTGYRSGAQQLRTLTLNDTAPAQPEEVEEQEIGLKTQFFDQRLTFNISAFHNEVTNAQRSVILSVAGNSQTILENADTETTGVEADLSLQVTDSLNIFATGSAIEPEYGSYDGFVVVNGVLTPQDKSHTRFIGIAENQFSIGLNYERETEFGQFNFNASYAWRDEMHQTQQTAADFIFEGQAAAVADDYVRATTSDSLGVTNMRASLKLGPDERYEVAFWGRNVFDERSAEYSLYLGGLGYVSSAYNEPAAYGLTLAAEF